MNKKIVIIAAGALAVVMVCLTLMLVSVSRIVTAATPPQQDSNVVFKTPEEAITSYMEGVAQSDIDKILRACAIDEMSGKFQFALYINRINAFQPTSMLSPSDYPLYIKMNKIGLSSQILNQVRFFAYSLLSSEKVDSGMTITDMDAERINKFLIDIDPARLTQLQVRDIGIPKKTLMSSANYLENATWTARIYGADETTERVVLFSFGPNYYFMGFTLLRYGESWKIRYQHSVLAGTNYLGTPTKTTKSYFESLLN